MRAGVDRKHVAPLALLLAAAGCPSVNLGDTFGCVDGGCPPAESTSAGTTARPTTGTAATTGSVATSSGNGQGTSATSSGSTVTTSATVGVAASSSVGSTGAAIGSSSSGGGTSGGKPATTGANGATTGQTNPATTGASGTTGSGGTTSGRLCMSNCATTVTPADVADAGGYTDWLSAGVLCLAQGSFAAPLVIGQSNATVEALCDGDATIDITDADVPALEIDANGVSVLGLNLAGTDEVVHIGKVDGGSLRRSTVRSDPGDGGPVTAVSIIQSDNFLVEDLAVESSLASPLAVTTSLDVTVRRVFLLATGAFGGTMLTVNGSSGCVVENCVATQGEGATGGAAVIGFGTETPGTGACADDLFYGDIVYGLAGAGFLEGTGGANVPVDTQWRNGAVITSGSAVFEVNRDSTFGMDHSISVLTGMLGDHLRGVTAGVYDGGVSASVFIGGTAVLLDLAGFAYAENAYLGVAPPDGGVSVGGAASDFATGTYGLGAYLFPPTSLASSSVGGPVGAQILYATLAGGTQDAGPLWPWPMEGRIYGAFGVSVTWASDGGLWTALPPGL